MDSTVNNPTVNPINSPNQFQPGFFTRVQTSVVDTAANLANWNGVLLKGQIGYETDTISFKIGNGSTAYNSLTYVYGGVIKPLSGTVAGNTTYNTIPNVAGTHIIYIPAAYLVAASGGPWTLTLGTGSGTTVVVPIAAAGDTLLSGALLFNVYVDGSGNVTSDYFEVQGNNSRGTWVKKCNGEMYQYGAPTVAVGITGSVDVVANLPVAFVASHAGASSCWPVSTWAGFSVTAGGNVPSVSTISVHVVNTSTAQNVYLNFCAWGTWR